MCMPQGPFIGLYPLFDDHPQPFIGGPTLVGFTLFGPTPGGLLGGRGIIIYP
jgi:hypothetical protein